MATKVLVTGGAGFIGSNLIGRLLLSKKKSYRVICVDNLNDFYNPKFKLSNIAPFRRNRKFSFHKVDIRNFNALGKVFKKENPEIVVHLAAKANTRLAVEDPHEYHLTNIGGTLNLLELAKEFGVQNFIFASSSSVYGNKNKVPLSEDDKTDYPLSPYGATKKAGELMAHTYNHNFGLSVTCLRFFTVYGERNRPDMVMYKWAENFLTGRPIEISGAGKRERDYTYVGDIVDGIIKAMEKPLGFAVINLGNSQPASLVTLAKVFKKVSGANPEIKRRPSHKASVERTFARVVKAKRLLGWQPKTGLEEGVGRLIRWFRNERLKQKTKFD